MKRLALFLLLLALVFAVPGVASAQSQKGDKEVGIGGNMFTMISSGSTFSVGQFQFGVGYFMSDRLEVGVTPILMVSGGAGTGVSADMGLSTKAQYFMGQTASKVKPYVGGSFIIQSFKSQAEGMSVADNIYGAGTAGVKSYFTERAALDFNASFGLMLAHPGDGQILQLNIGITYLFK